MLRHLARSYSVGIHFLTLKQIKEIIRQFNDVDLEMLHASKQTNVALFAKVLRLLQKIDAAGWLGPNAEYEGLKVSELSSKPEFNTIILQSGLPTGEGKEERFNTRHSIKDLYVAAVAEAVAAHEVAVRENRKFFEENLIGIAAVKLFNYCPMLKGSEELQQLFKIEDDFKCCVDADLRQNAMLHLPREQQFLVYTNDEIQANIARPNNK